MPYTFSGARARTGSDIIVFWLELALTLADGTTPITYFWSDIPLGLPGRFVEPRLISVSEFTRELSDEQGQYSSPTFSWTQADVDGLIKAWYRDVQKRYARNRDIAFRLQTDADRRLAVTPLLGFRGIINNVTFNDDYTVAFEARDFLTADFDTMKPERLITKNIFADCPDEQVGKIEPVILGEISDEDQAPELRKGATPLIYVGTETISAAEWGRLLVSAHACKEIVRVLSGGLDVNATAGVDLLVPGMAGWPFGANYRDIGGRRYCLIYARGPMLDNHIKGTALLTANVKGLEMIGDSTGVLAEIYHSQGAWMFIVNYLLRNYLTGVFSTTAPAFASDPSVPKALYSSFTDTAALALSRSGFNYKIGAYINTQDTTRNWLAQLAVNGDCNIFFNGDCQLAVSMLVEDPTPAATATLTETLDIISFKPLADRVDQQFNTSVYDYKPDYVNEGKWWSYGTKMEETITKAAYGREYLSPRLEFRLIRDSFTMTDIMAHRLARSVHPPREVQLSTGLHGLTYDVGSNIYITDSRGIGTNNQGWVIHPVRVKGLRGSAPDCLTSLLVRDLEPVPSVGVLNYILTTGVHNVDVIEAGATGVTAPSDIPVPKIYDLGGSRQSSAADRTAGSYIRVYEYKDKLLDGSVIGGVPIYLRVQTVTTDAAVGVRWRLSVVDSNGAWVSTIMERSAFNITIATWTEDFEAFTLPAGVWRVGLEFMKQAVGAEAFCVGWLEL